MDLYIDKRAIACVNSLINRSRYIRRADRDLGARGAYNHSICRAARALGDCHIGVSDRAGAFDSTVGGDADSTLQADGIGGCADRGCGWERYRQDGSELAG